MNPRSTAKLTTGQVRIMNKALKTILIVSIAIFGIGILLLVPSTFARAQTPNIVVEIWDEATNAYKLLAGNPIFDVSNFLPGETKTERIRVTNNTSQNQWVGLKVIKFDRGCIGGYCLADKLYLTVKPLGNSSLYSGSLTDFYQAGEVPFSEVSASGGNVQYDFSVSFDKNTTAKEYQGSTTNFDLEIGFFTKETVSPEPPATGGGYIPPISGVVTTIIITGPPTVTSESATISLITDIPSYCRIIYDTDSHPTLGNPPNYGYYFSTDPTPKSTSHTITLTSLTPDNVYFYRAVCWASPLKISQEYSFTTLGIKEIGEIEEEIPAEGIPYEEEIPTEEVVLAPTEEEKTQEEIIEGEKTGPEEVERPSLAKERSLGEIFATEGLLAAIGAIPFNLRIILIFAMIIIVALLVSQLIKKRKKLKI